MKKRLLLLIVLPLLFVTSCTSDEGIDEITPPNTDVTYNGSVKTIIDGKCLGCHGEQPVNGAPMSLTTFAEVKEAVENRNLIGRIEDGTMPPGNSNLSAEEIQAIKDWQAGNFKEQ